MNIMALAIYFNETNIKPMAREKKNKINQYQLSPLKANVFSVEKCDKNGHINKS